MALCAVIEIAFKFVMGIRHCPFVLDERGKRSEPLRNEDFNFTYGCGARCRWRFRVADSPEGELTDTPSGSIFTPRYCIDGARPRLATVGARRRPARRQRRRHGRDWRPLHDAAANGFCRAIFILKIGVQGRAVWLCQFHAPSRRPGQGAANAALHFRRRGRLVARPVRQGPVMPDVCAAGQEQYRDRVGRQQSVDRH